VKKSLKTFILSFFIALMACTGKEKIGFTGPYEIKNGDTIRFQIPDFEFYNQDSIPFNNKTLEGKVYAMSFFFTSCPGMCPKITGNLTALHEHFKDNKDVQIASISIDPNYDNCQKLKIYSKGFQVDNTRWNFLRNDEAYTHDFIQKKLYQSVVKDPNVPGGFDHSSKVLLVDQKGRLRKFYDGLKSEEIDQLIHDIELVLDEK
jgi:protein SCO1/2